MTTIAAIRRQIADRKHQQQLAEQRVETVRALAAEGALDREIATHVGMTRVGVRALRVRNGIPAGLPGRPRGGPRVHGRYGSYTAGCRCDACREAMSLYCAKYRAERGIDRTVLTVCRCDRKIRVAKPLYQQGPVICGLCGQQFTAIVPIAVAVAS